ncbi:MAG: glycine cleavage system protein T [Tenericutes bacterium HGW-Tenericutes-1]|jgi:aminomethyltransferase|nr:MAG: glycine cleavage system protein T [Tenericutes bacterium HGW-Tenericutes-1]
MEEVLKTSLYEKHVSLNAKMEPFAGYLMPIQYEGIIKEHTAVRTKSGMFDVSHMGEIYVKGTDAVKFVEYITTNELKSKPSGKVVYGLMLYENGTVVDDLLTYKYSDEAFLLVVNASNVGKDYHWIVEQSEGFDVLISNHSDDYSEVAVQGPATEDIVKRILNIDLSSLGAFEFTNAVIEDHDILISRTGYTGEDGFEIYGDHIAINLVWDRLYESGEVLPCGLGARDTLRFEAALPLYGHEISDKITPIEAGFGMFVKFDKGNFIGRDALLKQKADGLSQKVVGIELTEKAIPRQGYPVFSGETQIGVITTGYLSITAEKPIAMALIDAKYSALDTPITVQIRTKHVPGFVRNKQFIKKNYKK